MASKYSATLLLSVAASYFCLSGQAWAGGDVKLSLQTLYASRDAAFASKNIQGILASYSVDVVMIDAEGGRSKGLAAQRDDLSKLFASNLTLSVPTTQISEIVEAKGGQEATLKAVRHLTVGANFPQTGQPTPTVVEEVVRDHWVKRTDGWHVSQERRLTKSTLYELCSAAGRPAEASIIGKWVGSLPSRPGTTAQMTVEFTADGKEQQTIAAPHQNIAILATYTAQNNVLTETQVNATKNGRAMPGAGQKQVFHYRVVSNTLFLSLPGSADELQFARQPE